MAQNKGKTENPRRRRRKGLEREDFPNETENAAERKFAGLAAEQKPVKERRPQGSLAPHRPIRISNEGELSP